MLLSYSFYKAFLKHVFPSHQEERGNTKTNKNINHKKVEVKARSGERIPGKQWARGCLAFTVVW